VTASPSQLSRVDLVKIRRFAEARIPAAVRHEMRLEVAVHGQVVTLVERRAPGGPTSDLEWVSHPIAQLRFNRASHLWSLYWRATGERWRRYGGIVPAAHVEPLLAEIAVDPYRYVWG
jgi:hypothetical protein